MQHSRWLRLIIASAAAAAAGGVLALDAVAAPDGWLSVDGRIDFNPASGASYDWANSGLGGPTGTCPAGAIDLGGTGGLFNCGHPNAGSAPPAAPTRTPAAAADPSIISSVFLVDPISTDTTSCGTGAPRFSAGKNGDAISSYTFSTGTIPDKDTLTNVYAVSHTRSSDGHPELYFAAERFDNNGDSHIDFEFLQSNVTLSAPCSGSFTGHRTEGDLLAAVDFTTGGTLAGTSVYQWHCAAEPGPQPADGTVCDPSGASPAHYQLIPTPGILTLAVNAAPVGCGGWVCRDKTLGTTTTVAANEFLEGGINLEDLPFAGCFNTFLPHTRTAQSFTSVLKDFAGPIGFSSCRDPVIATTSSPTGGTVAPGTSATDAVTVGSGGAGPAPTGTATFFLCAPAQVTSGGCPAGGTQVGAVKTLAGGAATSDPTAATSSPGTYCWRSEYAPDSASTGVYTPAVHTNATTECFGAVAATLPNTGAPPIPDGPSSPVAPLLLLPFAMLMVVWRRGRVVAVLLLAGIVSSASPVAIPDAISMPHGITAPVAVAHNLYAGPPPGGPLLTEAPRQLTWRVAIPRIGIDAGIEPLGRDANGAMESPSSLDTVGWFNLGARPGQSGDAVLDGHFGLPHQPAVFRDLRLLRPGDVIHIAWPDGRAADFRVASSTTVPLDATPAGLFTSGGPARLSLITCTGAWDQSRRTYTQRLIVTADLI